MTRENSNGRVETHLLTAKNQIFKPQTGTAAPAEQRRSHASGHASCVRPCVMRQAMRHASYDGANPSTEATVCRLCPRQPTVSTQSNLDV